MLQSLRVIANREKRTPEEVAMQLIEDGLRRESRNHDILLLWQGLSPREQEITALICLHYTNRQIASRLGISTETVKSHVGSVFTKFELTNRNTLRQILLDWDFSEWDE